jgi:hypothetical protein
MRTALAVVALLYPAASAHAADAAFCTALDGLRAEAMNRGAPQRIAVLKGEAMTFACGRDAEVAAQKVFCDTALNQVGVEFTHAFPWYVRDCLSSDGVRSSIKLLDQYTGLRDRKKIVHMWGQWKDGIRIDVHFEPSGDFGDQPRFRSYWGAYKLVVWRPNQ